MIIIIVASYITLFERIMLAHIQNRSGPSIMGGVYSLLQPLLDGLKLLLKTRNLTTYNNNFYLANSIYLILYIAIILIIMIPITNKLILFNNIFIFIYFIIFLLLSSLCLICVSYLTGNNFSLLSNLRHYSLLYSYSLSIIIIFFGVALINSSFSLIEIKVNLLSGSYLYFNFFFILWFLIIIVTEVKKIGFDVIESEGELASGFFIEFSQLNFALLVLSEYIIFVTLLLLLIILLLPNKKIYIYFCLLLILVQILRAILPNYRYDFIIILFWKYIFILILLSTFFIILILLI